MKNFFVLLLISFAYSQTCEIKNLFIGSKKNINYLGINPLIEPIVGKVLADSPASFAGLKKDQDRADLIEYLNTLSE